MWLIILAKDMAMIWYRVAENIIHRTAVLWLDMVYGKSDS
jgi:hypothetical protein